MERTRLKNNKKENKRRGVERKRKKKQKRKKTRGEDCEEKKFPRGIDAVEGKVVK